MAQFPSTDDLRNAIGRALQSHVKNYDLAKVCSELGITPDETTAVLSKWRTVLNWLSTDRGEVLKIAERVLARYDDFLLEELIWKSQEQLTDFTEVARRQIISTLSKLPGTWGTLGASATISQLFPLNSPQHDPFSPNLEPQDIEEARDRLNLLSISEQRFRKFLERLVDPTVRDDDEQTKYVKSAKPPTPQMWLGVTGNRRGYGPHAVFDTARPKRRGGSTQAAYFCITIQAQLTL